MVTWMVHWESWIWVRLGRGVLSESIAWKSEEKGDKTSK